MTENKNSIWFLFFQPLEQHHFTYNAILIGVCYCKTRVMIDKRLR